MLFARNVGLRWAIYAAGGAATFVFTKALVAAIPEFFFIILALAILLLVCIGEERERRRRRGR
jgi:hypothetical protein